MKILKKSSRNNATAFLYSTTKVKVGKWISVGEILKSENYLKRFKWQPAGEGGEKIMDIFEKEMTDARKQLTKAYKVEVNSKNFSKKLENAYGKDSCMLCRNSRVLKDYGVCLECAQFIDRDLTNQVEKDYKVEAFLTVNVKKL